MKQLHRNQVELIAVAIISMVALITIRSSAITQAATSSTTISAATQSQLQLIISTGNGEINRRLTTLNNLTSGINSAQFLSASDKSSLSSEVSNETNDLTSLQTKLDAETTIIAATTDDLNVITEYRVYVLVAPKIYIVITADNQQATESALTSFASDAQNIITAAQNAGKDVTTLQSELSDLNNQVSAAQSISSAMETGVIGLQPTDYNSDHTILVGDYNKLETAQSDNAAAINDANEILSGLQSL
jgi:hypothetical protein